VSAANNPNLPRDAARSAGIGVTQSFVRAGLIKPGEGIRPTGPAAAAVTAAGIGALTLGGAGLLATVLARFDQALSEASRLFLPGGDHLGRFGGQQLLALGAWLLSWALLHWRWRSRQVSLTAAAGTLAVCLVLSTLLLWPPITRVLIPLGR